MGQKGWLTKHHTKRSGPTWVYHFYRDKPENGKRVENTVTIGSLAHFPREKDVWAEVERRYLKPDAVQNKLGRVTFRELVENYRKKSFKKSSASQPSRFPLIFSMTIYCRAGPTASLWILNLTPSKNGSPPSRLRIPRGRKFAG
jgi:hypothetical protein